MDSDALHQVKKFAETICKRTPGTFSEMIARNFIIVGLATSLVIEKPVNALVYRT